MSLTDLQVFNDQVQSSATEIVAQEVDKFNAASNGAIVLTGGANQGDYNETAMYKKIAGLVRDRDAYATGAVSAVDLEDLLARSVKCAAGTPPVNIDPRFMSWLQRNMGEAVATISTQMAGDMLQNKLNKAIGAFVGALRNADSGAGDRLYDGTASTATLASLNNGSALLGDRSSQLAAWVMHSKSIHDIYGTALTNTERLFKFEGVQVVSDGFGRPLIVTDSTNLVETGSPNGYYQCGIVGGGIALEDNGDFITNVETSNGDENIQRTFQAEWSYNVGLKGYAWDATNGGASPTNAEVLTGSNWDQISTDVKDTAGVLVLTR